MTDAWWQSIPGFKWWFIRRITEAMVTGIIIGFLVGGACGFMLCKVNNLDPLQKKHEELQKKHEELKKQYRENYHKREK